MVHFQWFLFLPSTLFKECHHKSMTIWLTKHRGKCRKKPMVCLRNEIRTSQLGKATLINDHNLENDNSQRKLNILCKRQSWGNDNNLSKQHLYIRKTTTINEWRQSLEKISGRRMTYLRNNINFRKEIEK